MAREGDPTALWSCADRYKAVQMAHNLEHVVLMRAPRGGPTALISWRRQGQGSAASTQPWVYAAQSRCHEAQQQESKEESYLAISLTKAAVDSLVASLCLAVPDGRQRVLKAVPLLAEQLSECRVRPLHLKVT